MSDISTVAFWLTYSPVILLLTVAGVVEIKNLYYFSAVFFGTLLPVPKVVVVQPGRKVVGKESIYRPRTSSTRTSSKRIGKKEAIIVLRALGPVQLIDVSNSWVKVARARRRQSSDLWFAICCAVENHHEVSIQHYPKVVLEQNQISGQFRAKSHGQIWFLPDWKWN